jgi:hypothetical protein
MKKLRVHLTPKEMISSALIFILLMIPSVSAESLGTGQGFVIFGIVFSIIITALFFTGLAIVSSNTPMKVFFLAMALIIFLFNIGVMVIIVQEYFSTSEGLSTITNNFFYLIATLFTVILLIGVLGALAYAIKSFKFKKGMLNGENLMK